MCMAQGIFYFYGRHILLMMEGECKRHPHASINHSWGSTSKKLCTHDKCEFTGSILTLDNDSLCVCVPAQGRECVCALVPVCDKSGSILWSATEASVIGQAMSLLLLKGFFAQRRGHRRVILPFAAGEIPQDPPHSSSLTKLLTRFGRHVFQLSNL